MRGLAAGLIFVNAATVCGLLLGLAGGGLRPFLAGLSLAVGFLFALAAYLAVTDGSDPDPNSSEGKRYRQFWLWTLGTIFAIFAARSFCWLLYIEGPDLKIQSPNNLGDLALHITYIKNFASGVALWPDNPIFVGSQLRYPAGTDLFNALLYLVHVDLTRGLIWAGLLGSLATFYAFWRWGGAFGIAGFLFNGGTVGFQFLLTFHFLDYQGDKTIAWKSIPLSMFVTQRGLLYAIPAGLLLLWHWREKFYRAAVGDAVSVPGKPTASPTDFGNSLGRRQDRSAFASLRRDKPHGSPLPFWIELALYASMPLFHAHTFLALSAVLVFLFACGDGAIRKHIAILVAAAFLPATLFVWLISDHFHAASMIQWKSGWVTHDSDMGGSFFIFWFRNFGILMPLVLVLLGLCGWRIWKKTWHRLPADVPCAGSACHIPEEIAFLSPAVAIFAFGMLYKTAPWEWDNLKIMVWSYFLVLPFLWTHLIRGLAMPVRIGICIVLFGSGFVSLFGGLAAGRTGFGFANRAELDGVGAALQVLPIDARFAAFPTYNHPLLLHGRKVVMGYPGHLWTQGFDYSKVHAALGAVMNGAGNWRETARALGVRYIFWGREEKMNYPESLRPWEATAPIVATGDWGAIYDLEALEPSAPRTLNPKLPDKSGE